MDSGLCYAGIRSIHKNGESLVVSTPKRELRKLVDVDLDEIEGSSVRVQMTRDGVMEIDFSDHIAND